MTIGRLAEVELYFSESYCPEQKVMGSASNVPVIPRTLSILGSVSVLELFLYLCFWLWRTPFPGTLSRLTFDLLLGVSEGKIKGCLSLPPSGLEYLSVE